ncbi:MAG: hypothetical protein WAN79_16920 [Opitutaceae bacterium]
MPESKDFTPCLISRTDRIPETASNAWLELMATDANMQVDGIEKVANLLTKGVLLTAPIIGSALTMPAVVTQRDVGVSSSFEIRPL